MAEENLSSQLETFPRTAYSHSKDQCHILVRGVGSGEARGEGCRVTQWRLHFSPPHASPTAKTKRAVGLSTTCVTQPSTEFQSKHSYPAAFNPKHPWSFCTIKNPRSI